MLQQKGKKKDGSVNGELKEAVSVVIPAYNEETSIALQVDAVHQIMKSTGRDYEVIVVNDGSTDETEKRVDTEKVKLISLPENRGYGAALKTGISEARNELIVMIDADGTYSCDAIPELLDSADGYDMVVGARVDGNINIPVLRRPAKWLLQKLASYLTGKAIPDLNSGLRVIRKPIVERYSRLLPSGFSFTSTITLACLCNDHPICYRPIPYHKRIGRSKIRPVDAYHFLLLIIRTIVYFNPLKVFLPLGALFFLGGLGKFIYDLFIGNLSESAVLGFVTSFLIWAVGLLSDQISKFGLGASSK